MHFPNGIDLPILFHSDGTWQLSELEIDFNYDDCITMTMTFYSLSGIHPDLDDSRFSCVRSGGDMFTCPIPYEKLKARIAKHAA